MHWIAPTEKDSASASLEKRLWDAADQFRANSGLKAQEYSGPILGLIFLRFAEVRFAAHRAKLEKAGASSRRGSRVDEPAAYHADNVLYLSLEARFDFLLKLPEAADIGAKVNAAMRDVEKHNPQLAGVLPKTFNLFTGTLLKELLKKISEIPATLDFDAFGRIYEYFLSEFAMSEGQGGGEFYTPSSIVQLLAKVPGADGRTQIAFASHSPMFVSMAHVDEIRFARRANCEDGAFKVCELRALDLEQVAQKLAVASQRPAGDFTAATLAPRLHILGPELSEGFFADGVVLVEGPGDRSALVAAAHCLGVNFESAGIAVLPVVGKTNIDRLLLIFRELGIPAYAVWDCDRAQDGQTNLRLLRAADPNSELQVAPLQTAVHERYAHFQQNLEGCLRAELGGVIYDEALGLAVAKFDVEAGRDAQKNPEIMKRTLALARERGAVSATLNSIVRAIWAAVKGIDLAVNV